MGEPPQPRPREAPVGGLVGALAELARALLSGLPSSFLVLCLLNVAFLALALRWIEHQSDARAALIGKILDTCLQKQ